MKGQGLKRAIALAAGLTLCAAALTGCGDDADTAQEAVNKELQLGRQLNTYEKDIVQYANQVQDNVTMSFVDSDRNDFKILNRNMDVNMSLLGDKGVYFGKNSGADATDNSLLAASENVVIEDSDGKIYTSKNSINKGRMNVYSHGLYYYDSHLLDLRAVNAEALQNAEVSYTIDFNEDTGDWNECENSECAVKDGALVFRSAGNSQDRHSVSNSKLDLYIQSDKDAQESIKKGDVVRFRIKSDDACRMRFYWEDETYQDTVEDKTAFTDDAMSVSFDIEKSEDYKDYYIDLSDNSRWTSNIKKVSIVLDSDLDSDVSFDSIELINKPAYEFPASIDFGYYTYPEKQHEQTLIRFTDKKVDNIKDAYADIPFVEDDVESVLAVENDQKTVSDITEAVKNGSYTGQKPSALMFKTKKAALGFIIPQAVENGLVDVVSEDGQIHFKHHIDLSKGSYNNLEGISVARRILLQDEYDEAAFLEEIYLELNPLNEKDGSLKLTGIKKYDSELNGYNPVEGYYEMGVEGTDFQSAYDNPIYAPTANLSYNTNDGHARKIYVKTKTIAMEPGSLNSSGYPNCVGTLEGAVILDENNTQLPVKVQVSKNFAGEDEEKIYREGDPAFGDSYYPVDMEANEELSVTTRHLFQHWGNHDIKQISSILFFTPYYHLSTGCTETSCWAPLLFNSQNGFMICDYRGWSNIMWEGQPQHYSIGEHHFVRYKSDKGTRMDSLNYRSSDLTSVGPNYSDFTMNFTTDDNAADVSLSSVELPQTDETRLMTKVKVKFREDVTIENAKENFSIYDITGYVSGVKFAKAAYLDDNNEVVEMDTEEIYKDAGSTTDGAAVYSMGDQKPFIALYKCLPGDANSGNCGAVVDEFSASIDGKDYGAGDLVFMSNAMIEKVISSASGKDDAKGYTMDAHIGIDADTLNFKKGDTIEYTLLMSPYGSYEDHTCDMIVHERDKMMNNPFTIESDSTEVSMDETIPVINAEEDGETTFTVKGGDKYMVVKVEGYDDYEIPEIYYTRTKEAPTLETSTKAKSDKADLSERIDQGAVGKEVRLDFSTKELDNKDGLQAYVTEDGKYGFAILLNCDGGEATYRVVK